MLHSYTHHNITYTLQIYCFVINSNTFKSWNFSIFFQRLEINSDFAVTRGSAGILLTRGHICHIVSLLAVSPNYWHGQRPLFTSNDLLVRKKVRKYYQWSLVVVYNEVLRFAIMNQPKHLEWKLIFCWISGGTLQFYQSNLLNGGSKQICNTQKKTV